MGPDGSANFDVYLRTAVSVDPSGWAQFDYVKMPDYRWGIFLNPVEGGAAINFGEHKGEAVWQDVPGEHRANLRRIIVTQGRHRARVRRAAAPPRALPARRCTTCATCSR
jgi:benzoyl-CoA 2,3-dioxygenase component B